MYRVDLNSDLGESFGNYTIGMDEEILKYVSSANVACGWHAGDAMVMEKTVALAKEFGWVQTMAWCPGNCFRQNSSPNACARSTVKPLSTASRGSKLIM